MAVKDGPTRRVLQVLRLVSLHGPITLGALVEKCDFSRAAVWRALDVLRSEGWIRMRLGDNAFVSRTDRARLILGGLADYPNAETFSAQMASVAEDFDVDVVLGGFTDNGFEILESTAKPDYKPRAFSLVRDPIGLAAQLELDRVSLVNALRQYTKTCSRSDQLEIESGRHAAALRALRDRDVVRSRDGQELSISFRVWGRFGFGLMIRSRTGEPVDVVAFDRLRSAVLDE